MALLATWMSDNIGSSSAPIKDTRANVNFEGFYIENDDATGGTARGVYMRLYLGGAGQSGESGRFFTTVNAAGAVGVHGIHNSLSFGTSGVVTGEGAANRATLQIPNRAQAMGTISANISEINCDGASSDPSGTTVLAFHRFVSSGNATGMSKVDTSGVLFSIEGLTAAGDTTKILSSVSLAELPTGTVGLRVNVAGTMYRLPLIVESQWN